MPRRASDPPSTAKTKRGVRKTRPSAQEHAQHAQHSPQADPILVPHRTARTAQELYRAEKERRTRSPEQDLLAEARREYLALLASEAGGPKGGRPRKVGRPKKAAAAEPADDFEDVTDFEAGDDGDDDQHTRVEKL